MSSYHERFIIRASDCDSHKALVYDIQERTHRLTTLACSELINQFLGHFDWVSKFNHSTRTELVRVKVVHATRDNFESAVWVVRQSTEGHQGNTS